MSKDTNEEIVKDRKKMLRKIVTFLIHQSLDEARLECLKKLTFFEFLLAAGMFDTSKNIQEYSWKEKQDAKQKYLNALSVSFGGIAKVFSKRKVRDIFVNGFNNKITRIFQANHDIQICLDPYAAVSWQLYYKIHNKK